MSTRLNIDLVAQNKIGTNLSVNQTSEAINIELYYGYSMQFKWTGAQSGNFKIQASNDLSNAVPASMTWDDVSGTTATIAGGLIAGADHFLYTADAQYYKWIRIVWTRTAGAGTLDKLTLMLKDVCQ